jgi:hypothetical protein
MDHHRKHAMLAENLSDQFSMLPEVVGVALGGSSTGNKIDQDSDIDLYIFSNAPVSLDSRQKIARDHKATKLNLDLRFWDPGDEWFDGNTGIEVDIMYWDPQWIEDQINLRLDQHVPSLGYTTCLWHTIKHARVLMDQNGWLGKQKEKCNRPFPEPLRQAIIRFNYPVLRDVIPAYLHQIEKAIRRKDLVSINHRVAAFLASYFDIIFALNRVTHPGEKKLLQVTPELCSRIPNKMVSQIEIIFRATLGLDYFLVESMNALVDELDLLLINDGFNLRS